MYVFTSSRPTGPRRACRGARGCQTARPAACSDSTCRSDRLRGRMLAGAWVGGLDGTAAAQSGLLQEAGCPILGARWKRRSSVRCGQTLASALACCR